MKSYIAKPADIDHKWYVIDAEDKTLGKVAAEIAMILRGKKKPIYTPHVDCGDYVVVVNAEKVAVTGKKEKQKKPSKPSNLCQVQLPAFFAMVTWRRLTLKNWYLEISLPSKQVM